jgi:hypothetical protein
MTRRKANSGTGFARSYVLKEMRRAVTALLLSFSALALFPGFSQVPVDPRGKQVIDAAVAALGGDHFLQMRTRMASGRAYLFFHNRMSGLDLATIYTEYIDPKPAKGVALRERELLGKKKDYSYLFLSDQGWDITFRGARPIPDDSWERYVRTTENDILYILRTRHDEAGMDFDFVSSEVYITRHVEIVDITDKQGHTIRVYFDHNTHLPIRESYTFFDSLTNDRNEEISVFDKYRDVGQGIMWPYSIERERNGYKTYQLFADNVQANVAIPNGMFDLPQGTKMLKKVE